MTEKKWEVLAFIIEVLVGVIISLIVAVIFIWAFRDMDGSTAATTNLAGVIGIMWGAAVSAVLGLKVTFKDKVKK